MTAVVFCWPYNRQGHKYRRPIVTPSGYVVGYLDRWGLPHITRGVR